jgi:hypothetical protein
VQKPRGLLPGCARLGKANGQPLRSRAAKCDSHATFENERGRRVSETNRFDETVELSLRRDEAIVLLTYLSRELWMQDEKRLTPTFEHPAEAHALHAVLQELIPPLADTGDPDRPEIHARAKEHLMNRFR